MGDLKLIYEFENYKIQLIFNKRFTLFFIIKDLNITEENKIIQFCKDLYYNL